MLEISAARLSIIRGGFNFNAEYAYKINDPSYQNHFHIKKAKLSLHLLLMVIFMDSLLCFQEKC